MKYFLAVIALLGIAYGQTTTTTFTITDSDSQTWNNGRFIVTFVPKPGNPGPYVFNGHTMTAAEKGPYNGSMNGSGTGTVVLPSNDFIVPSGTKWQFVLAPNASAPSSTVSTAVTGASQDFSASFSSQVAAPRFAALGSGSYGYLDGEVTPIPNPGGAYFNVTNKVVRIWDGTMWINGGGSGTGTVTSVAMQGDNVVYNTAVTGSPITTSGTLIPTLKVQNLHTVFGNPTGGSATPFFTDSPVVENIDVANTATINNLNVTSCTGCGSGVTFPLLAPDGSAIAPSYSFSNNTNMGLYRIGNNVLGIAVEGVAAQTVTSTNTTFPGGIAVTGGASVGANFSVTGTSSFNGGNEALEMNNGTSIKQTSGSPLYFARVKEVTTPVAPNSGEQKIYAKAGSGVCSIDNGGTEYCVSGAGAVVVLSATGPFSCDTDQNVCAFTLTWPITWPDTNYTAVCDPEGPSNTTGDQSLANGGHGNQTTTTIDVYAISQGTTSKSYSNWVCWGKHN